MNIKALVFFSKNTNNMKLNNVRRKDLLSLIKDDLTHIRLVYGLEVLGLNAGNYYLNLNVTIFKIAGIKEKNEDFFEKYIAESREVHNIDIFKYPELLNDMALRLYKELKKEYKAQKHEK